MKISQTKQFVGRVCKRLLKRTTQQRNTNVYRQMALLSLMRPVTETDTTTGKKGAAELSRSLPQANSGQHLPNSQEIGKMDKEKLNKLADQIEKGFTPLIFVNECGCEICADELLDPKLWAQLDTTKRIATFVRNYDESRFSND